MGGSSRLGRGIPRVKLDTSGVERKMKGDGRVFVVMEDILSGLRVAIEDGVGGEDTGIGYCNGEDATALATHVS